ncbi:MAG: amidohydrolase family protein [Phaeodactylibacter sp.]|nr:amidohydrolase family protein [Phaeodactylibacter sp.]MCB9272947.1 amidohydrolase family protein [Lewinellaceae bacterium]
MKRLLTTFYLLAGLILALPAQETFPHNGVYGHRERYYAFTGATVYTTFNQKVDNATLLIREGKVLSVTPGGPVPQGAVEVKLDGKTVYPGFIDLYSSYGLPQPKTEREGRQREEQMLSDKPGAYAWNEALRPEYHAHEFFNADDKAADGYRQQGFTTVATHQMDGISRGTSALVALGDESPHEMIIREQAAHHLSFRKGTSSQDYPSSLMGAIALLRQTYYDGQWYAGQDKETNLSLEAWNAVQGLPQVFEVSGRLEALRAAKIGREFDKHYIIKGSGDEYQRLDELKALGAPFILPLDFPDAYDVEDPYDAQLVSLEQMKHWELAPSNPARAANAGIELALTMDGLEKPQEFLSNLRKAVRQGLSEQDALKALTYTPAKLVGAWKELGSLEPGKWANFFITDGNIFDDGARILHTWVKGNAYVHHRLDSDALLGQYQLTVGAVAYMLEVKGEAASPKMTAYSADGQDTIKVKFEQQDALITLSFNPKKGQGAVRLSGTASGKNWAGRGQDADGNWLDWSAAYTGPVEERSRKKEDKPEAGEPGPVTYPFTAFGWTERPKPQTYLIRNATVWTNEDAGILENTDVLLQNGKIAQAGKGLKASGAIEVDGTGKHLTPGIIDEHSHIAISRGVNEGTQASSAEVRIGDVVNSEDVNIYRQLSGGVTTSQLLHGSANPIGGQSALIKLRWGYTPEEMKFEKADGFIKFALGENVKQSNWGDNRTTRFPQTRMGVEQVYVDHFTRAREYGKLKRSGKPYRKDLEMEALLEVLEGRRFITCHSYRQSEINMLMKVAERFGFRINTFTHILEGYKVADKMAEHGVGGSTFSDWWAYKYEVMEAIPYNGALMHEQGVTVAFNSDDAEMARRLNQEAAKAVLFGGVSEQDALKFVTLNPAKLLHIDNRVGSIKVGKDADVVLWSDHPLSMYAKADMSFIDGALFFSREEDMQRRLAMQAERNRLIQKMLKARQGGERTQGARGQRQYREYHCDDDDDEAR